MKFLRCYLCNSNSKRLLWAKEDYTIVQCNDCEFIYTLQQPNANLISEYYNNFDYKSIINAEKTIRTDAQRSLSVIARYFDHPSDLFDIGCGRGFFLDEARKKGWTVSGIDRSKSVISYARKMLRLNVISGDITRYNSKHCYPLITLNQVFEHFNEPFKLLRKCYELLTSGGYIYIATPNIESVSAKVHGEHFDHLIPPEHLSYFSKNTLAKALTHGGFRMVYSGSWSYPADLGGIIKKLINRKIRETTVGNHYMTSIYKEAGEYRYIKKVKSLIFDDIFCHLFYRILNFDSWGINLEVIAQKP